MGETKRSNTCNIEHKQEKKSTINTIQMQAYLSRLCIQNRIYSDIWSYDSDNLYPNKIRATWQRSQSAVSASKVHSDFIAGEGVSENDVLISENITIWDLLRFTTDEFSIFNGFAIHVNYNIFGEKTDYTLVPYELVRMAVDEKFVYISDAWDKTTIINNNKEKFYLYDDNPEVVRQQIDEAGGIDKYTGQIFYYKNTTKNVYTTALCDAIYDSMQLEHEIGVYNLMNIQNNYPISAIIKLMAPMGSQREQIEIQSILGNVKGSQNAGKAIVVDNIPQDAANFKMIEQLSRENIDKLFVYQKESARDDIFACYQMPLILAGISKGGIFNQEQYRDAFDYYNSKVETQRKDIEKQLNILLRNSIYDLPDDLEIIPKKYITTNDVVENVEIIPEQENITDGGDIIDNSNTN